jgi:hypothetical protein
MATSLRTRLIMELSAILDAGITGVNAQAEVGPGVLSNSIAWTQGTGSGQADRIYYAERQLAASANETLDLAGVLEDVYGNAITFAKVYAVFVKNVNTAAAKLEIGPNSSNGFGVDGFWGAAAHRNVVNISDGVLVLYSPAGVAVTAGTADLLYAENKSGSNALTYRIAILGTSA